ncbi:MFS transporter [Vibrio aquaticus]|uniref:MFS transporter n=1 Tax=Vibrio aquaticus TaxID=2496559 RepID=A0A3S0PR20_9VIBR|nr:multidrug effflux MFS transporter [Vibrio aquaticus]RTZ18013.1 MFS transporter [Vibrio aquaticus]
MKKVPSIWLMVTLMMFPQIIETIYSPVLPNIAQVFDVTNIVASQTLSVYFSAFAVGVVFWGIAADYLGRRRSMLLGLTVYGLAAIGAMFASNFEQLISFRALSAFGAAVGSVVTQTMLRDSYDGVGLAKVFGYMGVGISISPVIGLMSGGVLADIGGYQGVFAALSLLAVVLVLACSVRLPETKPEQISRPDLARLMRAMLSDKHIWLDAIMVAAFNIVLFSYYLQGPFVFESMGFNSQQFGYSGVVLAAGTFVGSVINKSLLKRQWHSSQLIWLAVSGALAGAVGVYVLQSSLWFLAPMLLIVASFGVGIPNLLSGALVNYKAQAGSAGALFGLMYYLMIGLGLSAVGTMQDLGLALSVFGTVLVFAKLAR